MGNLLSQTHLVTLDSMSLDALLPFRRFHRREIFSRNDEKRNDDCVS
jgi:hypothetical protein